MSAVVDLDQERARRPKDETTAKRQMRPRTWAGVPAQAMQKSLGLYQADHCVLNCISWHADATGYAFPSLELMAAETGWSKKTVVKSIKRLVRAGLITIKQAPRGKSGRFTRNGYQLNRKRPDLSHLDTL